MAVEHINENDSLNAGRVKINAAIDQSNDAIEKATNAETNASQAVTIANDAKTQAQSTQTQLDNIIIENGQSDAEVVQARTKADGTTFPLLKDRLNDFDDKIGILSAIQQNKLKTVYGIKADGTDETEKLQNALNNESEIWIYGTIGISSPLQWNGVCNVRGTGTIKALVDMDKLLTTDNSETYKGGTIDRSITLDCNNRASVGVYIVGKGIKVHCKIKNFKTYGIQLGYYNNPTMYKAWETDVSGCEIIGLVNPMDASGKGTIPFTSYPSNGIYISYGSTDNEIYQNIIKNTKNEHIIDNAGSNNIHDNHVYNYPIQYTDGSYLLPDYCFGVYGPWSSFENNYADSPLLAGFFVKMYSSKVCNNRILFAKPSFSGNECGVLLDNAVTGLIIQNNLVIRNSTLNTDLVPYDVYTSGNISTTSRIENNNGDVLNKFDSKNKHIRASVPAGATSFKISLGFQLTTVDFSVKVMPEWDYGYIYITSKGLKDIWFSVTKAPTSTSYVTMDIDYFG